MDEAYFKWKTNKPNPNNPSGRGSKGKIKVDGFVNRDYKKVKVFTKNISSLRDVVSLIKQNSMINHLKQNWTDGEIYTQNIKNFWKHTRRLLNIHIRKSHKCFHLYPAEEAYRWNNNATFIEFLKEILTPSS